MAGLAAQRKSHVRALRSAARASGVGLVRDDVAPGGVDGRSEQGQVGGGVPERMRPVARPVDGVVRQREFLECEGHQSSPCKSPR